MGLHDIQRSQKNYSELETCFRKYKHILSVKLSFTFPYVLNNDLKYKHNKLRNMCRITTRTLNKKTLRETQMKFYKVMASPMLICNYENWTMNRSDKKEKKIEAGD